jgi:hypothetical protein
LTLQRIIEELHISGLMDEGLKKGLAKRFYNEMIPALVEKLGK